MSETPGARDACQLEPTPIVFAISQWEPDVSLTVFDQVFHVHSAVLKLKSVFFRKFLDSPDKVPAATRARFKYEWVSRLDEYATGWHLVCSSGVEREDKMEYQYIEWIDTEMKAFHVLLRAMYGWSFAVDSLPAFHAALELADYYCALPAFSAGLRGAFDSSPLLVEAIFMNPFYMLKKAIQLRNAAMYRECLILAMGPWSRQQSKHTHTEYKHGSLEKLVASACDKIDHMELAVRRAILNETGRLCKEKDVRVNEFQNAEQQEAANCRSRRGEVVLPWFYRNLYEGREKSVPEVFKKAIEPLMKNNLVLDSKGVQAGQGKYKDYFLCLEISDEDLPWNTEETDW